MENTSSTGTEPSRTTSSDGNEHAREVIAFCVLTSAMQKTLESSFERGRRRLFTVSTEGLYEAYLDAFEDPVERQHHHCHACRDFIRRFGGAVWLDARGRGGSALWGELDEETAGALSPAFRRVVARLRDAVEERSVQRQLLWSEQRWGLAEGGGFTHLWADVPPSAFNVTQTARQAMAERREDFTNLSIAVSSFDRRHVERAVGMLEAGGLEGADKILPMALFLRDTQALASEAKGELRRRILWAAVGSAARGWCSPRSSALGALIEDIAEGKGVAAVTKAHDSRLAPDKYQRPVAPPSAGNVAQAEKLVAELGLAPSLPRRPLALEELTERLWSPRPPKTPPPAAGVFGALGRKSAVEPLQSLASRVQTVTWVKLAREVLPRAESMAVVAPFVGAYAALTTAVDASAPPLFRWDKPEARNPVSWYTHTHGSTASSWGLPAMELVPVLAICEMPCLWGEGKSLPQNVALAGGRLLAVLQGAEEQVQVNLCLFPECLRSELHSVRATIEAHSRTHALDPEYRPRASGLIIGAGAVVVEVTTAAGVVRYNIDRIE